MTRRRPVVLLLAAYYLPGFKGGGLIRSLANLVESLGADIEFRFVAYDRDVGDAAPYPGVTSGTWTKVGAGEVLYLAPGRGFASRLLAVLREARYDVLYIPTLFDPWFTLMPLLLRATGVITRRPAVVAPLGQLMSGALRVRRGPKVAYVAALRRSGLMRDVWWHATSEEEASLITHHLRPSRAPLVATDIPPASAELPHRRAAKLAGALRLVFVSRISRKKNLDGALRMLQGVAGSITFDVHGPIEDREYWDECQRLIDALPATTVVSYRGELRHEDVPAVFAAADAFLFPTLGENFGHVILESLLAGCPPVLSDRTPWRGLAARRAGWDLPLEDDDAFRRTLAWCVQAGEEEMSRWREGARQYGLEAASPAPSIEAHRRLFGTVLAASVRD